MANEFHIRVIKLAKYEELRPASYGVQQKQNNLCPGIVDNVKVLSMLDVIEDGDKK